MKKLFPLFILMIIGITSLCAYPITLTTSPDYRFFNQLNASNFDPDQPSLQPLMFSLSIQNSQQIEYSMRVKLDWNGEELFETFLRAELPISSSVSISNQTLLDSNGSNLFGSPEPSINLSEVMNNNPDFSDAIMNTGRFPDGIYLITMQAVTPGGQPELSEARTFRLEIRNASAIYLQRPGVQLGGMIPSLSLSPLTFAWNSNLAGITVPGLGRFTLTIREFNRIEDLQLDTVENGQVFQIIPDIAGSIYSGYIPFQGGKYYAWQISTPLAESNQSNLANLPTLKSPWFVFKFVTEGSTEGGVSIGGSSTGVTGGSTAGRTTSDGAAVGGNTAEDELVIILTDLNNPQVNGLLNDDFRPTGNVWVGDQLYTGNSAMQQLQRLAGKTIKSITVSDE